MDCGLTAPGYTRSVANAPALPTGLGLPLEPRLPRIGSIGHGKEGRLRRDRLPVRPVADATVEGIVNGIYFNQGHVCCAGSRLLVQESIYEACIDKLKRRLRTLRVGDPLDKNTDVGHPIEV